MRTYSYVQDLSKELRKNETKAEKCLWNALRDKGLNGYKFHRQRAFKRYILDFYCPKVKLVLEIDGAIHDQPEQHKYDHLRELDLQAAGFKILRLQNDEVLYDLNKCLKKIQNALERNDIMD